MGCAACAKVMASPLPCQSPRWGLRACSLPVIASLQSSWHCEPAKQSLFCALPALNKRDCRAALGGLRFVIASLRSNLSFVLLSPNNRDYHPLLHCHCEERSRLSLRACEAISLFCLPGLNNRDCRATLAMTGCSLAKQSLFSA